MDPSTGNLQTNRMVGLAESVDIIIYNNKNITVNIHLPLAMLIIYCAVEEMMMIMTGVKLKSALNQLQIHTVFLHLLADLGYKPRP